MHQYTLRARDGHTEDYEYGFDLHVTKEVAEILYPLHKWKRRNPERFEQIVKQMWLQIAAEALKAERVKAKA